MNILISAVVLLFDILGDTNSVNPDSTVPEDSLLRSPAKPGWSVE